MQLRKVTTCKLVVAVVVVGLLTGIAGCNRPGQPEPEPPPPVAEATPTPVPTPTPTLPPMPTPAPTPEPVYNDEGEWRDGYAMFLQGKKAELVEYTEKTIKGALDDPDRQTDVLSNVGEKLFFLYDLDRNGIPELLLINGEVFTYKHGKVRLMGNNANFWVHWEDTDDITFSEVGIPDDGSEGLLVFDSTTFIPGRGRKVDKISTTGSDIIEGLKRISFKNDIVEVKDIYTYDNVYDYYTRRVYWNAADSDGHMLNLLQYEWLKNLHTYTEKPAFHDITEETILEIIYDYKAPEPPEPAASAATDDELAYAGVFEQMVDILGGFYNLNLGTITEISGITYAFHDIDGNGVNEMIISDGHGATIYTLAGGTPVELVSWGGNWHLFHGITETGYICGAEVTGESETTGIFYKFSSDGESLMAMPSTGGSPSPYVKLDWNKLTYKR